MPNNSTPDDVRRLFDEATPEMIAAYVDWEPPCEVDCSRPARMLGLLRAAFFGGWLAARSGWPADRERAEIAEAEAIAAWNQRAALKPAGEVVDYRQLVDTCIKIEAARWPENADVQDAIGTLQRRVNGLRTRPAPGVFADKSIAGLHERPDA